MCTLDTCEFDSRGAHLLFKMPSLQFVTSSSFVVHTDDDTYLGFYQEISHYFSWYNILLDHFNAHTASDHTRICDVDDELYI
jgi:hypothetical protein